VFAAKPLVMDKGSPIKDNKPATEVVTSEKSDSTNTSAAMSGQAMESEAAGQNEPAAAKSNEQAEKEALNDPTPSIMFAVTIKKGCRQDDDFADS
jgi:hypothetical protein